MHASIGGGICVLRSETPDRSVPGIARRDGEISYPIGGIGTALISRVSWAVIRCSEALR